MDIRIALLACLISATAASNASPSPATTGAPADSALCADTPRRTVPDMRVEESHLDRAAALEAADRLRARIAQGELHGDLEFGALNALKILEGHVLREQALAVRREAGPDTAEARDATGRFCRWLADEGFWYD